jgi:hypothetical protein
MDATVRTPVVTAAALLCLCLGWLVTEPPTPAVAQLIVEDNTDQPEEPGLELDIDALLTDNKVFEASVNGNVWDIGPMPGRRLIQIPIIVTPKTETTRLATPSLKLRGGRFIAWHIVPDEQDNARQTGGYESDVYRYDRPTSIGALRGYGEEDLGRLDQPSPTTRPAPQDAVEFGEELPEDVPMMARDMEITPQGVMHWQLERAIPGAEVKSGDTGYLLRLRPDRLAELEPERPGSNARSTGGRSSGGRATSGRSSGGRSSSGRSSSGRGTNQDASREAAAKRRAEELEFRDKIDAYRELRSQVRDLPDEFQAALPQRLWAIFEVSDRMDELSFTGPEPMPWRITEDDLNALKEVASKSGSGNELTAADFTAVSQMTLMLADEHPLTQRTVAEVLNAAGMLGRAQQGDALYRLISKLLQSGDPQAVRTTAAGLAAAVPPTPATLALLKGAFDQMDPGSKLLALGGLLSTQGNDPIGQRQMIETANQMISDPQGPGVVYVLDELTRALADKPEAVQLVGGGIRFDELDADALDQAIIYTADAAGDSTLAAEWMEHGLLGSPNARVVRRTIELLGTSAPGGGMISMLTKEVIQYTFGPANADAASRAKPPLRGISRIPIDSSGHSIYRVLNAGDPELRSLGWKALRHFQVQSLTSRRRPAPFNTDNSDGPDRLTLILDAAFNEPVTPPQLVTFLINQDDTEPATAALVRIVIEGRGPAITQAARSLVRSGRRLEQPIQALNPEQRGTFTVRLYEAVTGSAPMVAGLMRVNDARSPLVTWFARHISTSGLPEPGDWAAAARGDDTLLNLAANPDPELANAAVASLVASVGGDEQTARDLARRMSNATDRSVAGLRELWNTAKQEIYAAKLKHATGRYRLVVNLRGTPNPQPDYGGYGGFEGMGDPGGYGEYGGYNEGGFGEYPPDPSSAANTVANAPLITSINVALIELKADGRTLELASGTLTLAASDARLAIALQDPNELKDFGNAEVDKLPLENIRPPIELLPQKGGVWRGSAPLGDGRSIEVVFDPE